MALNIFLKIFIIVVLCMSSFNSVSLSMHNKFSTLVSEGYDRYLMQHNHVMDVEKNEMELQLLDFLGFSKRPKRNNRYPSLRKSAPQYLLKIFDSLNNDIYDGIRNAHHQIHDHITLPNIEDKISSRKTRNALNFITDFDEMEIEKCNNIITFLSRDIPNLKFKNLWTGLKMWFNLNQIPKELSLLKSELRIFQNSSLGIYYHTNWTITIYQIDLNFGNMKFISSVNTTSKYHGWLEIDITSTFNYWLTYPKENFGIILKTELNRGIELLPQHIGLIDLDGDEEYQPFVVGFFNGPEIISKIKNIRTKRDLSSSKNLNHKKYHHKFDEFEAPKICQRMNFSVNFKELNWNDWIIAPEKFDAFFCSGECNFPLGAGMNATNHALVQTLMHLKQPHLPKPCCAPIELSSISVLYYLNEESVNLRKYRHMIVNNCGCH